MADENIPIYTTPSTPLASNLFAFVEAFTQHLAEGQKRNALQRYAEAQIRAEGEERRYKAIQDKLDEEKARIKELWKKDEEVRQGKKQWINKVGQVFIDIAKTSGGTITFPDSWKNAAEPELLDLMNQWEDLIGKVATAPFRGGRGGGIGTGEVGVPLTKITDATGRNYLTQISIPAQNEILAAIPTDKDIDSDLSLDTKKKKEIKIKAFEQKSRLASLFATAWDTPDYQTFYQTITKLYDEPLIKENPLLWEKIKIYSYGLDLFKQSQYPDFHVQAYREAVRKKQKGLPVAAPPPALPDTGAETDTEGYLNFQGQD